MARYSYSKLNRYEECPLSWKRKYIEKRDEISSPWAVIGSWVHAAIAAYDRHLVEIGQATDITWAPQAAAAAYAAIEADGKLMTAAMGAEAEKTFARFVESHVLNPASVASIEEAYEFDFEGGRFKAVIDLLCVEEGIPVIRDYKTNQSITSQADVEKDFQLSCYAWSAWKVWGYEEVRALLDFVRFATEREVRYDLEALQKIEAHILRLVAAIEADREFKPTPGAHCARCSWSEDCSAISDLPLAITCPSDAHRVASELALLQKQVKDREEALRSWCTLEGPVTAGGLTWAHWPVHSKEWDVREFVAVLGDKAYDYISVSNTKVKTLLKKDGARLERIYTEKTSTRFSSKKAGDSE